MSKKLLCIGALLALFLCVSHFEPSFSSERSKKEQTGKSNSSNPATQETQTQGTQKQKKKKTGKSNSSDSASNTKVQKAQKQEKTGKSNSSNPTTQTQGKEQTEKTPPAAPVSNAQETNTPPASPTPVPASDTQKVSLPSSIGTLTYYRQNDPRWTHAIYGGTDTVGAYGCGPTVLAMLVSSFTDQTIFPDEMAQWAAANHFWAKGSGSAHNLIPDGATAFGFRVESFRDFTTEGVKNALRQGNILVALMGPGHLTTSGHFIIISDYWSDNLVRIADPANLDNTMTPWDINTILSELSHSQSDGGPVWAIAPH